MEMPVRAPPPVVSQLEHCLMSIRVERRMLPTVTELGKIGGRDDCDQDRHEGCRAEQQLNGGERQLLIHLAKLLKLQFAI
jgi:hypothetical protein